MATATSTSSGNWSAAIWSGGSGSGGAPADGDDVVIAAGHDVLMDSDLSAWTGLLHVTLTRHATTPAMLYFKDGTSGWLKFRDGSGYGFISSGASGLYGRILANSDGVWGNTTPLSFAYKAKIQFVGLSKFQDAAELSLRLYCTEPTHKYVRTYYDKYTVDSIDTGTNVITCTASHGWSANRAVRVTSSGTLPAPLDEDAIYYVGSPSGATLQLLYTSDGTAVDITSAGSGTIEIYSGYETYAGVTQLNVLDDVKTSDMPWTTAANHNYCCLVNEGPQTRDIQNKITMSAIETGYITISSALDSVQYPGARIWLISRNVSVTLESLTGYSGLSGESYMDSPVCNAEFRSMCGTETAQGNPTFLTGPMHGEYNGVYCGFGQSLNVTTSDSNWTPISFTGVVIASGYGWTASGYLADVTTNSGYIVGCTNAIYQAGFANFSGEIRGCSNVFTEAFYHKVSGKIVGCNYVFNTSAGHNTLTSDGKIASCNYVCTDISYYNIVSGTVIGVNNLAYDYRSTYNSLIFRNAIFLPPDISAIYPSKMFPNPRSRIHFESFNRIAGNDFIWDRVCNIVKTACDGTGDAPSVDPDGGSGYCIEVNTVYGDVVGGSIDVNIIENMRIWLSAGAHTIAFKIQTTYTTSVDMILEIDYVSTGGAIATATKSAAVTARSGDTDWANSITSDSFTTTAEGWVTVTLKLAEYEANDEIYVWPKPTIT